MTGEVGADELANLLTSDRLDIRRLLDGSRYFFLRDARRWRGCRLPLCGGEDPFLRPIPLYASHGYERTKRIEQVLVEGVPWDLSADPSHRSHMVQ
jgi:hypothetical protein